MTASVRDVGLAAEVSVLRALEVAGKRGRMNRADMGRCSGVPSYEVHTVVKLAASDAECGRLLSGAWAHLELVLPDSDRLVRALDWYVRSLIVRQERHHRHDLERVIEVAYE